MARMSLETRQRVITLHSRGHTILEIRHRLREENCNIFNTFIFIMAHFGNSYFVSFCSRYLKHCSVVISMLYCKGIRSYKAKQREEQYTSFVCIPTTKKLHAFNYMAITYGYFSLRRWDTDHCTQDEMAILMMYKFIPNCKG